MATPLSATYRITAVSNVLGIDHKIRAYVKSTGAVVSGTTQIIYRDASTHDWTVAITQMIKRIYAYYGTDNTDPSLPAQLEQFGGGVWNPVEFATLTESAPSGTLLPATETLITVRDTAFKKIRVDILETKIGPSTRIGSDPGGSLGVVWKAWAGGNVDSGNTDDPFHWQVSRGNDYIAATGGVVGIVNGYNDKMRRARGMS